MKRTPWYHWIVVGGLVLLVLAGIADAVPALRASGGLRFLGAGSAGTAGTAANPVVWADNTTIPNLRFGDGTADRYVSLCTPTTTGDYCKWDNVAGNWTRSAAPVGVSWPLTNGTSTNTYTSAVADGASAVGHKFDTTNTFSTAGDELAEFDSAGVKKLAITTNNASISGPTIESSGPLGLLNSSGDGLSIQGGITYWKFSGSIYYQIGTSFIAPQSANLRALGIAGQEWQYVTSYQYRGVSVAPAFSATVAVNCTTGETQHVSTVNANVTGATMTSGNIGEQCTVVWTKDGTGNAYTITWSGSNVRAVSAEAMSATASSLFIQTFRWDDRLGTAAWVETSSKQTP